MIYVLLANGASVIPQFLPGIPQLLLVFLAIRTLFRQRFYPSLPVISIIVGLIFIAISSLIANTPDEIFRSVKFVINALVSLLIATGIEYRYRGRFCEVYSQAIVNITIIGALGLILFGITGWNVTSSIGEREYHTNFLTSWLSDNGYDSSKALFSPFPFRLQAMFDEPGTYGMLLTPAFFYFVYAGKAKSAAVLLFGAFLSESANAWILCALILFIKAWTIKKWQMKLLLALTLLAAVIISSPILLRLYEVKTGLDLAYENNSSLSVRMMEYDYLSKYWTRYLIPFQNEVPANIFPLGISVSYINWYLKAGLIFIFMLVSVLITLIVKIINALGHPSAERYFALMLVGSLLLSGLQRSSFLDNVLFMSLTFWALMQGGPHHKSEFKV